MIKHILMFSLVASEAVAAVAASKFKAAIEALPQKIDALDAVEVGVNAGPAEGNWNIVLTAVCASYDALAAYSAHPEHIACVAIIKPYIAQRACVDYSVAD